MSGARESQLRFLLVFVALYGCILFLIRPDSTRAQTIFRLALIGIGIAGVIGLHVRGGRP